MDNLLQNLTALMLSTAWVAPLFAFLAGLVTSFSPCSLSTVPMMIGFVGGTKERDIGRAFRLSLVFVLGSTTIFVALGAFAAAIGEVLERFHGPFMLALGVLMFAMALQMFGVISIFPGSRHDHDHDHDHEHCHEHHHHDGNPCEKCGDEQKEHGIKGYIGAYLSGVLGGLFASHCAAPAIVALLALSASIGRIAWSVFLLLVFSVGHGVLTVIAGTSVGFVQKLKADKRYSKAARWLSIALGVAIILLGAAMIFFGIGEMME